MCNNIVTCLQSGALLRLLSADTWNITEADTGQGTLGRLPTVHPLPLIYPGGEDNSEVLMSLLRTLIKAANLMYCVCPDVFRSLDVISASLYMWGAFS